LRQAVHAARCPRQNGPKESLVSILPVVVVWGLALVLALLVRHRGDPAERRLLLPALALQFVACAGLHWVLYVLVGEGDAVDYLIRSQALRDAIRNGDGGGLPGFVRLLFQVDSRMEPLLDTGSATTRSFAAIVMLLRVTLADSIFAVGSALGLFAFFGRLALYRALRVLVPESPAAVSFVACMYLPSVLFWGGGMLKESVPVGGLGFFTWGVTQVLVGRSPVRGPIVAALGMLAAALVKPFHLVPYSAGLFVWRATRIGVARGLSGTTLLWRALAAIVVPLGLVLLVGELVPALSTDRFVERATSFHREIVRDPGRTAVITEAAVDGTLASSLAYAPFGLFNALFRPTLLDVRSVLLLGAAAETSVFAFLALRATFRHGLRGMVRRAAASPGLLACIVITLGIALVTGVTTPNLGSLARYRTPMLPFYFVALWLLGSRSSDGRGAPR
jgi:hypothetical protein